VITNKADKDDRCSLKNIFNQFLTQALDPCETAAQVFKCGVDSSVSGMTNLIAAGSTSGGAAAQDSQILFGKLRGSCLTNYSCVADVSHHT
jgi:hypothetical protein